MEKANSDQDQQWLHTVPWTPEAAAWVEDKLAAELGPEWLERAAAQRAKHARQRRWSAVAGERTLCRVLDDGFSLVAKVIADRADRRSVDGY